MQTATNSAKPSTNHSEANEHKTLGDIVGIKNASSSLFNFVGECEERHVWVWLRKHSYALNPNLTKCQYCFLSSCSASQKPKGARYHKNIKKTNTANFHFCVNPWTSGRMCTPRTLYPQQIPQKLNWLQQVENSIDKSWIFQFHPE